MVERSEILRIAEQVRQERGAENGDTRGWSVATCEFICRVLAEKLAASGLSPQRVVGYYAPREPAAATSTGTNWDGIWLHWWVECAGFVIDVTADRFGRTNTSEPVVVLPKSAAVAYQTRISQDPHRGSAASFEQ